MARLPYPKLEELPEKLRTRVEALPPLNILRMFLHAQNNAAPLMSLGESILLQQELNARLRELAILRVAHLTGANYEWTQHVPIAKQTGVTEAQVAAIPQGAEAAVFDDLDKRILRFTDEVTRNVKASEPTFRAVAERLSPRQMMELTLAIGFYGLVARIMETFEVELEPTAGTYTVDQLRRDK